MKKLIIVMMVGAVGLAGCLSSGPMPDNIENVAVVVAQGRSLKDAVVMAATRRHWTPRESDAVTVRCTLVQRSHRVVIDVCLIDSRHYSIRMVECNIPARKFAQWINNLQREIARYAARP